MNKKPSRPQVNPNTLKRLLGYLSVYKTRVIVVVICITFPRFFSKPILYLMRYSEPLYRWHAFM